MHLTNYAINKLAPNFVGNRDAAEDNYGHKRSYTAAFHEINKMGFDAEKIQKSVDSIIVRTVLAGYPKMLKSYHKARDNNIVLKQIR